MAESEDDTVDGNVEPWMMGIVFKHGCGLPEVYVECHSDAEDDNGVDNIPLVPTALGSGLLFGSRGAEYKTLDLCLGLRLSAETDNEANKQAEYQHATAEVKPVEVVEYSLEPTFGSPRST